MITAYGTYNTVIARDERVRETYSTGSVTTDSPTWTGELPADGDYTITLATPGAGTGYLLRVTIE